jgi:glycosyltransferase involved in cell wall biosynthesis
MSDGEVKGIFLINSLATGGAERNLLNLIDALDIPDENILLVTLLKEESPILNVNRNVKIINLGISKTNWVSLFFGIYNFGKVLWAFKPTFLNSHSEQCHIFSLMSFKSAKYWSMHTNGYTNLDPILTRLLAWLNIKLANLVSVRGIIGCNHNNSLAMIDNGYPVEKVTWINNGINFDHFESLSSLETSTKEFDFAHIARFHPRKDHAGFLKALEMLKTPVKVVMAGKDVNEKNLDVKNLKNLGHKILLLDEVSHVSELLARSKFLVISSSSGEALPMIGLEALYCGTPVLTTNTGSCHLLGIEDWQVVKPNDVIELAQSMKLALDLSDRAYNGLANSGSRLCATKFSASKTADLYLQIFNRGIAGLTL